MVQQHPRGLSRCGSLKGSRARRAPVSLSIFPAESCCWLWLVPAGTGVGTWCRLCSPWLCCAGHAAGAPDRGRRMLQQEPAWGQNPSEVNLPMCSAPLLPIQPQPFCSATVPAESTSPGLSRGRCVGMRVMSVNLVFIVAANKSKFGRSAVKGQAVLGLVPAGEEAGRGSREQRPAAASEHPCKVDGSWCGRRVLGIPPCQPPGAPAWALRGEGSGCSSSFSTRCPGPRVAGLGVPGDLSPLRPLHWLAGLFLPEEGADDGRKLCPAETPPVPEPSTVASLGLATASPGGAGRPPARSRADVRSLQG